LNSIRGREAAGYRRWLVLALLLTVPFTAIVHHLFFFHQQCILNPFGPRYDWPTVMAWLRGDPSPYIGLVLAAAVYIAGRAVPAVQPIALALLGATIPLSLWIWDLPFGDRPICALAHDGRSVIRGRHLYGVTVVLWPLIAWHLRGPRVRGLGRLAAPWRSIEPRARRPAP
jgi:hypothetical protein